MVLSWFYTLCIASIWFLRGGLCNELNVTLASNYATTGFRLNLLESIAAHNQSLYIPTLLHILGLDSEGEEDESGGLLRLDREVHDHLYQVLGLLEDAQSLIDFDTIYKIHSPRIIAHYTHFTTYLEDATRRKLNNECKVDRFGHAIPKNMDGEHAIWVTQNSKIYCSNADLFAIETQAKDKFEAILPFDRVIGDTESAPLLELYANLQSPDFTAFFAQLYREAVAGKIRFIWRYIPFSKLGYELLAGYGAAANIKSISGSKGPIRDIVHEFWSIKNDDSPIPPIKGNIDELGLKIAALVMYYTPMNISQGDFLETIVNDLPKYAPHIIDSINEEQMAKVARHVKVNENKGLSKESYGLYVNGSPVHKGELDILKLVEKVKAELELVTGLESLGFNSQQAKLLVQKFALLSAIKQSQFQTGNTLRGNNENRFRLFEHAYIHTLKTPRGIVYFNDLESDPNYQEFSSDREHAYLGAESKMLHPNQIPPLKENVHDVVFAIDIGDRDQLRVMFALAKIILDNGLPQQVGVVSLDSDDVVTLALIERFYFVAQNSRSEALALLYKFMEAADEQAVDDLLFSIKLPSSYSFESRIYQNTLDAFSINTPTVAFNGVLHELSMPDWQVALGSQIRQDVSILKHYLRTEDLSDTPLREMLYRNSESSRNTKVIPLDPGSAIYKAIDAELIELSILFRTKVQKKGIPFQIWIVGDFNKERITSQFVSTLKVVLDSSKNVQLRILHTGNTCKLLDQIQKSVECRSLSHADLEKISILVKKPLKQDSSSIATGTNSIPHLLERKNLPIHDGFLLLNSRYIKLDTALTTKELELLLKYEEAQRLALLEEVVKSYPRVFQTESVLDFTMPGMYQGDWFDLVSSLITKSFYFDDTYYVSDVARFDFSQLEYSCSIDVSQNALSKVDILLIIDPSEPFSQELVSIVQAIRDLSFASIKILLQPELSTRNAPKRYFCHTYTSPPSAFDTKGNVAAQYGTQFPNLPAMAEFQVELLAPHNWVAKIDASSQDLDLFRMNFGDRTNESVFASFILQNILIEGNARNVRGGQGVTGLALAMKKDGTTHDTTILSTFGYFQFSVEPGRWHMSVANESSGFHLLSVGQKFVRNTLPQLEATVDVFDLMPRKLFARFVPKSEVQSPKFQDREKDDTIHIYSVASGLQYERFMRVMMASVRKHTALRVKFWLLDNYLSPEFKDTIDQVGKELDFDFEYVSYKWPYFLRLQTELYRTVWGYKILFLDVLFPQSLRRVIYVDADQVARADIQELFSTDLKGAPYGFVPMCESRPETQGLQFWKQEGGFWQKLLQEDLKYHISALYMVDLGRFREMGAGDILRSQYQKISVDERSLANLDQDLPNSLQRTLPIHSLHQDWLWCETWCDEKSKPGAKMIDMCTNPLTHETKLDAVRRIIPEWKDYEITVNGTIAHKGGPHEKLDPRFRGATLNSASGNQDSDYESGSEWDHDEL